MSRPSGMSVREADWRDIPAMGEVERAAFDEPWSEATLWAELAARPRRHYLIATDGSGVLAHAGLDLAGEVADVMTLAVHPEARGRGLGARLLEELHGVARRADATSMLLEVRADNAVAHRLYLSRDYHLVRTRPGYYPGGVDALVLRKELS